MRIFLYPAFILTFFSLSSCAPSIHTTVLKSYQPQPFDQPVEVYAFDVDIPTASEALGNSVVIGNGTACDSITIVEILKNETRKVGGNAVYITQHIKPSIWGHSCHRMTGTLMHVSDFETITIYDDSTMNALRTYPKAQRKLPKMSIFANGGYGGRSAKLETDNRNRAHDEGLMDGFGINAGAEYYFNDNYGIGLLYTNYFASSSGYVESSNSNINLSGNAETKDNVLFVGPAFLMRYDYSEKWIFGLNIALGFGRHTSKMKINKTDDFQISNNHFAGSIVMYAEYKFNKSWGVNANIVNTLGSYHKFNIKHNGAMVSGYFENNMRNNVSTVGLNLGIRYYLK